MHFVNAPESRRRLAPARKRRAWLAQRRKAYLAEVRRQCRLANKADRRDNWKQYLYLPE